MNSGRRDGRDQSSGEVLRLEDDRGGAVAPRFLQEQLQPTVLMAGVQRGLLSGLCSVLIGALIDVAAMLA